MLETRDRRPSLDPSFQSSLMALLQVAHDTGQAGWLASTMESFLPEGRGLLALCPAESRDWRIYLLPQQEERHWPGDHPVQDEIRELKEFSPTCLENGLEKELGPGQSIWALPLRDSRQDLLGALMLAWPEGEDPGDAGREWLLYQSGLLVLVVERLVNKRRLVSVERELEELESLKSSFMDTVSHELKTPLTSILGFTSLALAQPRLDTIPPLPEFLQSIHHSALQLDRLINEVLVMSSLASVEDALEIQDLDLPLMMQEFRDGWLAQQEQAARIVLPEDVPSLRVRVDGRHFQRVLEHLLANALKFSPPEQQVVLDWLFIKGRRRSDTTDFLRINVKDEGLGISEDEQDRIFQKFYQIDNSSTREHGGAGLGLALAKKFTEAMGGRLWVSSEPGVGSTFSFTVPVARDEEPPELREARDFSEALR